MAWIFVKSFKLYDFIRILYFFTALSSFAIVSGLTKLTRRWQLLNLTDWLPIDWRRIVQYGLCQLDKSPVDVDVGRRRRLEKLDAIFDGQRLATLLGNDPPLNHVTFVADNHLKVGSSSNGMMGIKTITTYFLRSDIKTTALFQQQHCYVVITIAHQVWWWRAMLLAA